MADTSTVLAQWVQRHGNVQGQPFPIDPTVKDPTGVLDIPNPDPVYRYTFADGSVLDITGQGGQIKSAQEKGPSATAGQAVNDPRTGQPIAVTTPSGGTVSLPQQQAPPGWTDIQWIDAYGNGQEVAYGRDPADGKFKKIPDLPSRQRQTGSTARPVTATKDLEPVTDPTSGRPIALRDPSTGATISITQGGAKKSGTEDTVQGGTIYHWQYDADGNPHLKGSEPAPDPSKVPDDTQTFIPAAGGWGIPAVYRNGKAEPTGGQAIALTPAAVAPDAKPQEDTRYEDVVQGQRVTKVYRNGQWAIDPNVQPTPYGPQANTAAEVQRLQALAQQERDRINALPIDDTEKRRQWDQWWNSNVEPFRSELQRKQDLEGIETARGVLSTTNQGAQTGASLLNQRVSSATGLLNNLTGLAANSKITSVPAGLGGQLVSGVQNWITGLGGGPGVYEAAANMVHQANPKIAGTSLGAQATAAISQLLERQAQSRLSSAAGRYEPGAQANNPVSLLDRSRYTFSPTPAPTTTVAPDGTVTVSHAPTQDPLTTNQGGPLRGALFG